MHPYPRLPRGAEHWAVGLLVALAGLAGLTALLAPRHVLPAALALVLLTLVVSALWGYWVGLASAVLADLALNFFFIPPVHRFTVHGGDNVVALVVFLAVAVVGASMLAMLRRQAEVASAREAETNVVLNLTQAVARATGPQQAMEALCNFAVRALGGTGCSILQDDDGWKVRAATLDPSSAAPPSRDEAALAAQALLSGDIVRLRAPHRRSRGAPATLAVTIVPVRSHAPARAVLRLTGALRQPAGDHAARLLRAFADEAGLALQRTDLAAEADRAETLKRADEFKSVLLSSVSHDLRSPLTAIQAAIDNLRDPAVTWNEDDTAAFRDTIASQTGLLTRTVDNLLELSRLEGGAARVVIEPVEVSALFEDVVQGTANITAGRTVESTAEPDLWLRADYGLLLQALTNLVENAARYSAPGGSICLRGESGSALVRLSVRDEGPGIAATDLPHVFEKFYRGSGVRASRGTGLGLAIVAEVVKLCRGTVAVQSTAEGATFTLNLPRAAAPA